MARVKREFFSVRTVAEAQRDFRPDRRTATETVPLEAGLDRVAAEAIASPGDLPGFARAAVDGYAVRAADTFGASTSVPLQLRLIAEIEMGAASSASVGPGEAATIPTGGALPAGADAVVMVERTNPAGAESVEILETVAPGEAVVRADEDVPRGTRLIAAGFPLRPEHLGLLAAAGVTSFAAFARPQVTILSTGDELVSPSTATLAPGQIRDATASALAAHVLSAGGKPTFGGIVADDAAALRSALEVALSSSDLVVVSAGSSVGARDVTAEVVDSLGPPGIWCHGLALKPGKPTLLAECDGVPLLGLPGNPASALVVFRLLGVGLVRMIGGHREPQAVATTSAVLARDVPSAPGRLDVVQVTLTENGAEPLFAKSSALSALARADGQILVSEEVGGLYAGSEVVVELYSPMPAHG
ncbi:MAG: molybdopterin molybdotransferase MoeA [Gaiellaceae bacterium]